MIASGRGREVRQLWLMSFMMLFWSLLHMQGSIYKLQGRFKVRTNYRSMLIELSCWRKKLTTS